MKKLLTYCNCYKKIFSARRAFSLAEILSALLIIGIVVALVIVPIERNINKSAITKKNKAFAVKFEEGLQMMRMHNKLAKTYNTASFIDELENYFNIVKVCDNNALDGCFSGALQFKRENYKDKTYDIEKLKNANSINDDYKASPVYGIKFSDGTDMLISYIPECYGVDREDVNGDTKKCLLYLYDVNSAKAPNTYGGAFYDTLYGLNRTGSVNDIAGNIVFPDKAYGLSFSIEEISGNLKWSNAEAYCRASKMSLPDRGKAKEIADKIFVESGHCTYLAQSSGNGSRYNCSEEVRSTPLWNLLMSNGSVKSGGNIDSFYFWTNEDSGGKAYDCIIGQNAKDRYYWWGCYLNSKTSNSLHAMCVD